VDSSCSEISISIVCVYMIFSMRLSIRGIVFQGKALFKHY